MPTKYTMATLPKPENPNVQVRPCHRWHGPAPMPVDCAGQDMTLHLWVLPWTLTLTPASTLAAPNGRLRACRSRRCLHKPSRRSRGGALTASLASCPPQPYSLDGCIRPILNRRCGLFSERLERMRASMILCMGCGKGSPQPVTAHGSHAPGAAHDARRSSGLSWCEHAGLPVSCPGSWVLLFHA